MKKLTRNKIVTSLLVTMGFALSLNVNAAQVSTETLTQLVISQSQNVIKELNQQLQQSISNEISRFTIDPAINVLVGEDQENEMAIAKDESKDTNNNQAKKITE